MNIRDVANPAAVAGLAGSSGALQDAKRVAMNRPRALRQQTTTSRDSIPRGSMRGDRRQARYPACDLGHRLFSSSLSSSQSSHCVMEDPHAQRAAPLLRMFLDVGIDFARWGQGARELGEGWLFPSRDVAEKSSEETDTLKVLCVGHREVSTLPEVHTA
ncbi:hypothetical protein CCHR01_13031 [Colletotrichum chrysophilum]|uniref:Uncharacterized protein n=1 Tax=Colletotrichum chrysophilum TaxID=1836956 RepID=A0AAD9AA58_9PEZI|nr:hypothetical protein CCHR01_13031 [Colletotrichum chrysophilum]